MSKTTRLVVQGKSALLGIIMIGCVLAAWPTTRAFAQNQGQEQSQEQPKDQWGEKTPPAGFVQSKEPSRSKSPYNWRQMEYGGVVVACMGLFMIWLIRKNKPEEER